MCLTKIGISKDDAVEMRSWVVGGGGEGRGGEAVLGGRKRRGWYKVGTRGGGLGKEKESM